MRVPNADQAIVPSRKITQYLLDLTSPKGHDKAVVFTHFGFSMAQWEKLEIQLLKHIADNNVSKVENRGDMTIYVNTCANFTSSLYVAFCRKISDKGDSRENKSVAERTTHDLISKLSKPIRSRFPQPHYSRYRILAQVLICRCWFN